MIRLLPKLQYLFLQIHTFFIQIQSLLTQIHIFFIHIHTFNSPYIYHTLTIPLPPPPTHTLTPTPVTAFPRTFQQTQHAYRQKEVKTLLVPMPFKL